MLAFIVVAPPPSEYATTFLIWQVRVLTFIAAKLQADVPQTAQLMRSIGSHLARVDAALSTFDPPALRREHMWPACCYSLYAAC